MRTPQGMEGSKYLRIEKSLCCLKQSGKAWHDKLDGKLLSFGLKHSSADECIYIHQSQQLIVAVYVDDMVICGKLLFDIEILKEKLSSCFTIKDMGEIGTIIGWKIDRDRSTRTLKISQS